MTNQQTPPQSEMPFAIVQGQHLQEIPQDLYIPPDALEVILEAFEGPLDLLLYLIRKQNLDILDIPIADITEQYIAYIEMLQDLRFELAAEYLVMAAILAEIKSKMLLPRPTADDGDEEDPRADLIRRLQEYEQFKKASEDLNALPREDRDFYVGCANLDHRKLVKLPPEVDLNELLMALRNVLARADMVVHHQIEKEALSVREKMSVILSAMPSDGFLRFEALFDPEEGRSGIVVSFLAVLELIREKLIDVVQTKAYGSISLRTAK